MTDTAPSEIDILARRIPIAADDLSGLTADWHLWDTWQKGMHSALVRHLDGEPGDPAARYVAVVPYLFTWGVIVGRYDTALICFDDRWCYHSVGAAVAAAHAWDGQGEPEGWHRHPRTGRRRENGDPAREEVRW